ncbi:MAG: hypothetical protein HYS16_01490 [Deltaproteobacteria bacterium]|nr:MAG: hypothetical protein HYS16_01490 [Deltaproteobacteria bacterium]
MHMKIKLGYVFLLATAIWLWFSVFLKMCVSACVYFLGIRNMHLEKIMDLKPTWGVGSLFFMILAGIKIKKIRYFLWECAEEIVMVIWPIRIDALIIGVISVIFLFAFILGTFDLMFTLIFVK